MRLCVRLVVRRQPEVMEMGREDCSRPPWSTHPHPGSIYKAEYPTTEPHYRRRALQEGARVTVAPLFWNFAKIFGLFQFPPPFSLACLPSSFSNSTLLCLDAFSYYVVFPAKQNLASMHLVKIWMAVWVRWDTVQSRWEISNRLLLRGPQTSLLVP